MAHITMVHQPLEKSNKKHDYNSISKKIDTTPTSTSDRLTTKYIINASLQKSIYYKYLTYQTRRKGYCGEKNNIYDSPTVEQF